MTLEERLCFLSSRLLHLILFPTEKCNLRCAYCYEDFEAGAMPETVVASIKALLARRAAELDLLSLEWFGGEPLLAWSVVEEIQAFACELAKRFPKLRLVGTMVTNGVLLSRRRLERLLELGVRRFQITLDGAQDLHDTTRTRRGGSGTFETIWSNLLAMQATEGWFETLLRLHVTQVNQESVARLLADLATVVGKDRRFEVMLKAVRRFGGPNDAELPLLEGAEEEQVLDRLFGLAADLGLRFDRDPYRKPGVLSGCYASALGSYVVRSNGDLAKCSVTLSHPNNRIGALLPDGTVSLDSSKMSGWLRGALDGDLESLECPSKGWADDRPTRVVNASELIQIGGPERPKGRGREVTCPH